MRPHTNTVAAEVAVTTPSTVRSSEKSIQNGRGDPEGTLEASRRVAATEISRPSPPPSDDRNEHSTSNWRTSRPFDAPIDVRMAISRDRAVDRIKYRFATLAHDTSSTITPAVMKA